MKKKFYFMAGLPRSGSTLLASILNQHPDVYVTPTSPLLPLLIEVQNKWHTLNEVAANPNGEQLTNIVRSIISSTWEHRQESIIIDKNRGWGKNMPASSILFEGDIKVIATVRDLPSIMASWLTIINKNPNSHIQKEIQKRGYVPNDENIMAEMWFKMVKDCMESVVALKKTARERTLFVDYDDLMINPKGKLDEINSFLDLSEHSYDLNNITTESNDDDLFAWGLDGMHRIRANLGKTSKDPKEVLGKSLYERFIQLEKDYKD